KKVSKVFDKSLEFIASNLEDDNRTIKSLRQMNQDTKLSHYRIRKYLSDLKDSGLIIRKKQRLLLNVDAGNLFG
ncbi:replication/maintenance protein RepL, partial [Borrelia persica]|uniref:replication/maintenance protein RepL n=2 Tax=Borrelia persica TaxID=44448 RepID=UPI00056EAF24